MKNWAALGALVALLLGFQFWGEHQRKREWWWMGGDRSGMNFIDLSSATEQNGHVLSTDGAGGDEFEIEWDCSSHRVKWGAMWSRDQNFDQIERRPAPTGTGQWHRATEASELRVLEIACAPPGERFRLRAVKTERPPIAATKEAMAAVKAGTPPHMALFDALGIRAN